MTDWEKRAREVLRNNLHDSLLDEAWNLPLTMLQLGREMAEEARFAALTSTPTATEVAMQRERDDRIARAAADARAEEIAKAICDARLAHEKMRMEHHDWMATGMEEAEKIVRSTISKPKEMAWTEKEIMQKPKVTPSVDGWSCERCGQSGTGQYHMCVRPFSEITVAPDGTLSGKLPCGHDVEYVFQEADAAGALNGDLICGRCEDAQMTKTREQVLEEALRQIDVVLDEKERMARQAGNFEQAAAHASARMNLATTINRALYWKPK